MTEKTQQNFQKMLQDSLQVLNKLLAIKSENESKQSLYVKQLAPVNCLHKSIETQRLFPTVEGKLIDLVSIVTYYITPPPIINVYFISQEALKFVSKAMHLMKGDYLANLKSAYGFTMNVNLMKRWNAMLEGSC